MKKIILKIGLVFFLLGLMGGACEKEESNINEETIFEISPDNEETTIEVDRDGIEFKFCLLDEEGNSATVFKESENFTFYFAVTNNRDEKLFFDPNFAYSQENNFCRVYSADKRDFEKPFVFMGASLVGIAAYPFEPGQTYAFEQPWIVDRQKTWQWEYGRYKSANQKNLPVGNYFTEFKHRFQFVRTNDTPPIYTDTLNFKINFKIQ